MSINSLINITKSNLTISSKHPQYTNKFILVQFKKIRIMCKKQAVLDNWNISKFVLVILDEFLESLNNEKCLYTFHDSREDALVTLGKRHGFIEKIELILNPKIISLPSIFLNDKKEMLSDDYWSKVRIWHIAKILSSNKYNNIEDISHHQYIVLQFFLSIGVDLSFIGSVIEKYGVEPTGSLSKSWPKSNMINLLKGSHHTVLHFLSVVGISIFDLSQYIPLDLLQFPSGSPPLTSQLCKSFGLTDFIVDKHKTNSTFVSKIYWKKHVKSKELHNWNLIRDEIVKNNNKWEFEYIIPKEKSKLDDWCSLDPKPMVVCYRLCNDKRVIAVTPLGNSSEYIILFISTDNDDYEEFINDGELNLFAKYFKEFLQASNITITFYDWLVGIHFKSLLQIC
jgi:hypothetical protein